MTTTELHTRQVFSMRNRKNCELKFTEFYQQSGDVGHLVQAAVAAMVRNAFYVGDFSYVAKDLIRKVFLNGEVPTSARHLCIYFEDYFSTAEWNTALGHLYKNQAEYKQLTEVTRLRLERLRPALTSGVQSGERKLNLKAAFLDENGKMHTWGLSNVVSNLSSKDHMELLNILGELTIFHKKGLRQFTKVVWVDFAIDERYRNFDIRNENDPLYESKKSSDEQAQEIPVKEYSKKTARTNNVTGENSNATQSTSSVQPPVDQLDHRTPSKKKKIGKTPTDRMPSWKNSTAYGKKTKEERNLEIEKALRKKTGKKKNRKRK